MSIEPIRRAVTVAVPPGRAFDAFTRDIGRWWPRRMSIGAAPLANVVIEPHEGGRWFERGENGAESDWGDVLAWEPPGRVLLAWRIGGRWAYDKALHSELELRFTPAGTGTLVELEHRGLEHLGEDAAALAEQLRGGWPAPLQAFADFTAGATPAMEGASHG
jgi:uncharacterized protein YndB with AHSA1/START domain